MSAGIALAVLIAALIGVSLAVLGSGGSIITVPVLVYVAGVSVHAAVGMSLVIVGGFLIVPALLLVAGLDMKRAVPTSLAIIAFNAAGGLAGQVRYASFDWTLTAAFLGSALSGMVGGSMLSRRMSSDALRRGFGWAVMALGTAILTSQVLARAGRLRR